MINARIRLADWRDHVQVQKLRKLLKRTVDGGLWELLNWPMYHVHTASIQDQIVGFTSVALLNDGVADDVGTVIDPEFRNQGISKLLRFTQLRDLALMGWTELWVLADTEDDIVFGSCQKYLGKMRAPITVGDNTYGYFGESVIRLAQRIKENGCPPPIPLNDIFTDRLMVKRDRAREDLIRLTKIAQLSTLKALSREKVV